MKTFLSILVILGAVTAIGCVDAPVDNSSDPWGDNLLRNSEFFTENTRIRDLDATSAAPWLTAYYSPQIGAGRGCSEGAGYIQLWGNVEAGEGVMQELETPIRKGRTYVVRACVKFWNDNPENYTPYTRVRFVGFRERPPAFGRWPDDTPGMGVIGTVQTSVETWQTYTVAEWTADADYHWFAFNAENDNIGVNSASWAHVDNVELWEKLELER